MDIGQSRRWTPGVFDLKPNLDPKVPIAAIGKKPSNLGKGKGWQTPGDLVLPEGGNSLP